MLKFDNAHYGFHSLQSAMPATHLSLFESIRLEGMIILPASSFPAQVREAIPFGVLGI
jgi:hypothetical protein